MNKGDLIDAIAASSGLTKADAKKAVDAYHTSVMDAMKKGDRLSIPGFGSFSVTKRSARTGVNPQTKQAINIPEKNVVKFKPGSDLAGSVQ